MLTRSTEYFGFQVSSFILHNNALQCNRINKTEKLIGAYSPPNIHLFLLSTYLMESSNIQIYHTYILTSPLRCVLCVPQFWHRCIHNIHNMEKRTMKSSPQTNLSKHNPQSPFWKNVKVLHGNTRVKSFQSDLKSIWLVHAMQTKQSAVP